MTYFQSTGKFFDSNGIQIGLGYSGNGQWMNDPTSQNIIGHGPLPQGWYTIQPECTDKHTGPVSMRLEPDSDNIMFGRSNFLIHGDNASVNHTASDGCIILPHPQRVQISTAVLNGDNRLQVLA